MIGNLKHIIQKINNKFGGRKMSKYDSLGQYLERNGNNYVNLTFSEIEKVLGFQLPAYLYKYPAGWYGTAEGSPTHKQKAVWCSYGYQVETVNLKEETVVFYKI